MVYDKLVWVKERLTDTIDWLKERVYEKIGWLKDRLIEARDWIWDKVHGGLTWLRDRLIDVRDFVVDRARNLAGWLRDRIVDLRDWLYDHVWRPAEGWFKKMWEKIQGSPEWLQQQFNKLGEQLDGAKRWIVDQVDTLFDGAANTILEGLGPLLEDWFKGAFEWASARLHELGRSIVSWASEEAMPWLMDKVSWIWGKAKELFKNAVGTIISWIKQLAPITPEKAWNSLPDFLALAAGASCSAVAIAQLPSLKVAGTGLDFSGLAQHVSKLFSPETLVGSILGTMVGLAFSTPIKYYLNTLFRSYLPDFGVFFDAYGRNKLTDDQFKQAMAWYGIHEDWLWIYKELAAKPISPFLMRYFADAEIVDEEKFLEFSLDQGYKPEYADYVAKGMVWGAVKSYRSRVENEVTRAYEKGFIDFVTWRNEIEKARSIVEPVKLLQLYADWKAFNDDSEDRVRAILQDLRQGVLSLDQAREQLSKYIKRAEKIDDMLFREELLREAEAEWRSPNSLRSSIYSTIKLCYKEGFIDDEALIEAVDTIRQIYDAKTLIKLDAEWKAFYDDRKDYVDMVKTAYRYGIIDEAQFRQELSKYIVRADKLEALFKREVYRSKKQIPAA